MVPCLDFGCMLLVVVILASHVDLASSLEMRKLGSCLDPNPFISISHSAASPLVHHQNVTITINGVVFPSSLDWIAVVTPSNSDISTCLESKALYIATGDLASLPLLCHYPIKVEDGTLERKCFAARLAVEARLQKVAMTFVNVVQFQFLKEDPNYLQCSKKLCSQQWGRLCMARSCQASLTFDLINVRTDIKFVFFTGGMSSPCVLAQSKPLSFANPNQPLYGHLSVVDSSGTSVKLTWVSGDSQPQAVEYADGRSSQSTVTTFQKSDMCNGILSSAADVGWHDPGFIHSAILTGLTPSTSYPYKYGSEKAGWSPSQMLKTVPTAGSLNLTFIAYGDMGKAARDHSIEHYIQPGSLSVIDAVSAEVARGNVDLVLHIGDISYATGFLVEWDNFLDLITPMASKVPYMTAIGNHERDFPDSGSYYATPDSGGECGVAYENYFQMPTQQKDKPWYSFEAGPVHFTVMSTEHDWMFANEQYKWIESDLASVDRKKTPWLVFTGHRPQYSSVNDIGVVSRLIPSVDPIFRSTVEPLLLRGQVDVVLWGHVHNYERTCAVFQGQCLQFPTKGGDGVDVYHSNPYAAPVHAVIGMGGFSLDDFSIPGNWSMSRISNYGFVKVDATPQVIHVQLIASDGKGVQDSFKILK